MHKFHFTIDTLVNLKVRLLYAAILLLLPLIISIGVILSWDPVYAADMAKHAAFLVFCLILPALGLGEIFLRKERTLAKLFAGLPASLAWICVIAYIIHRFDLPTQVSYLAALPSLGIFRHFISSKKSPRVDSNSTPLLPILASVCVIGCVFGIHVFYSSQVSLLPGTQKPACYFYDLTWNLGNTWSFLKGYPLEDFRAAGLPLNYHMGQSMFQAMSYWTFGADPTSVHLLIDPLFQLYLLCVTLIFAPPLLMGEAVAVSISWAIGLFFIGHQVRQMSFLTAHLFFNPLTFFFSLSYLVSISCLLVRYMRGHTQSFFLIVLGFIGIALVKAPLLAILPCVVFLLALVTTTEKQRGFQNVKSLLVLLVSLLVIGFIVKNIFYAQGERVQSVFDYAKAHDWSLEYSSGFLRQRINTLYSLLVDFWPIACLILFPWTIPKLRRQLTKSAQIIWYKIGFAFLLSGIIIDTIWNFESGFVYPIWYGYIFLIAIAACNVHVFKTRWWHIAATGLLLAFGFNLFYKFPIVSRSKDMWFLSLYSSRAWDPQACVDHFEYEGLEWIQKNLPMDAVLITDRHTLKHPTSRSMVNRFTSYSAFSGRAVFNEGNDYFWGKEKKETFHRRNLVNEFVEKSERGDELFHYNMNFYLINSKRFSHIDFANRLDLKLEYENPSFQVFKVSKLPDSH